jgi:hypothetical protein
MELAHRGPFAAVDLLSAEAWPEVPADQVYQVELAPASGVVLQFSEPGAQGRLLTALSIPPGHSDQIATLGRIKGRAVVAAVKGHAAKAGRD